MISDGTANEKECLGALGDLQFALPRLDCGDDMLVAATDKLLAAAPPSGDVEATWSLFLTSELFRL